MTDIPVHRLPTADDIESGFILDLLTMEGYDVSAARLTRFVYAPTSISFTLEILQVVEHEDEPPTETVLSTHDIRLVVS